jgi:cell division protein FtsN
MSTRSLVISVPKILAIPMLAIALLAIAGCSREKSDWRSAQAADSPESYQQFIDEHPESSHVATARERLQQLDEEKDWRAAAAVDSLEAYQAFLARHPAGKWAKEAKIRIDNFQANAAVPGGAAPAEVAPPAGTASPGEPASVPEAPPAIASSGFGVQLGAFSSAERANEEWLKLQKDAAGMLDGLSPRVVVGDAGGKTIYRLQAEVRDEAQARAICGGLKVAKKPCVPVIPR